LYSIYITAHHEGDSTSESIGELLYRKSISSNTTHPQSLHPIQIESYSNTYLNAILGSSCC